MTEMVHLKGAIRRQTTAGTMLIVAMGAFMFGPQIFHAAIGEPRVYSELVLVETSSDSIMVAETVSTPGWVGGAQANTIEAENGDIICYKEQIGSWKGERRKMWHLSAFTDCSEPKTMYRVCSSFSVQSSSGRTGSFGPFCSGLKAPLME